MLRVTCVLAQLHGWVGCVLHSRHAQQHMSQLRCAFIVTELLVCACATMCMPCTTSPGPHLQLPIAGSISVAGKGQLAAFSCCIQLLLHPTAAAAEVPGLLPTELEPLG